MGWFYVNHFAVSVNRAIARPHCRSSPRPFNGCRSNLPITDMQTLDEQIARSIPCSVGLAQLSTFFWTYRRLPFWPMSSRTPVLHRLTRRTNDTASNGPWAQNRSNVSVVGNGRKDLLMLCRNYNRRQCAFAGQRFVQHCLRSATTTNQLTARIQPYSRS